MSYTEFVKCLRHTFLLLIACLSLQTARAEVAVNLHVYEDVGGSLTFDEVLNKPFTPIKQSELKFGFSTSAYWIRVEAEEIGQQEILLVSCFPLLDSITTYIRQGATWQSTETGNLSTFETRDIDHPCHVFDLSNAESGPVFVRAESGALANVPISLYQKQDFWQRQQGEQIVQGMYFAFLGALLAYNLFLLLIVRESTYFYYCGYLAGITLFLATMSGHSKMYLWPNSIWWADHAAVTLISLGIGSALMFISKLSRANDYYPRLYRITKIVAPLCLVVIAVQLFNEVAGILSLGFYMFIVLCITTLAIFGGALKRYPPAIVLLFTIIFMFPAALVYYFNAVGQLEGGWLTRNILHLTSAWEALIMSFALAFRIRALNDELADSQTQRIEAQSRFSHALLKAADDERRTIARELHDSFGQRLLVAKNLVKRLGGGDEKEQATSQLQHLISDTRNMARNMHPQQIEILGFSTALKTMLVDTLSPAGIALELNLEDVGGRLTSEKELHLYRIAQEFASNILKHASADKVCCDLSVDQDCLRLTIADNGVGIADEASPGLGLLNMKERAAIIAAKFSLENVTPSGSQLILEVLI